MSFSSECGCWSVHSEAKGFLKKKTNIYSDLRWFFFLKQADKLPFKKNYQIRNENIALGLEHTAAVATLED